MAKKGVMSVVPFTPAGKTGAAPLPGVPHFATKAAAAPRQNQLNIRVSPMKRMQAQVKPLKPDAPDNVGSF
jgi:hypothetical protein